MRIIEADEILSTAFMQINEINFWLRSMCLIYQPYLYGRILTKYVTTEVIFIDNLNH